MQVMPWGCELRDAGVLHSKHSGSLALGSRSSFHGLAKEIAARDLLAIEGWHAKRWAEPLANPRAHGKGLSRRVGLAPGRGAFARPRHAGPVRSSHPGMDSHRCALPRVLTDSVDNRLPSSLLFACEATLMKKPGRQVRGIRAIWSGTPGSNRRPSPWQGDALPAELVPRNGGWLSLAVPPCQACRKRAHSRPQRRWRGTTRGTK